MTPKSPKPQPIDFTKVEALRRHMLLTTSDIAEVLGVSRMTYYLWVKKGSATLRRANDEVVRVNLKKLLGLMSEGWPTPEVIAASQKDRRERLLSLLNEAN